MEKVALVEPIPTNGSTRGGALVCHLGCTTVSVSVILVMSVPVPWQERRRQRNTANTIIICVDTEGRIIVIRDPTVGSIRQPSNNFRSCIFYWVFCATPDPFLQNSAFVTVHYKLYSPAIEHSITVLDNEGGNPTQHDVTHHSSGPHVHLHSIPTVQ